VRDDEGLAQRRSGGEADGDRPPRLVGYARQAAEPDVGLDDVTASESACELVAGIGADRREGVAPFDKMGWVVSCEHGLEIGEVSVALAPDGLDRGGAVAVARA
jgi:hypothetical protein